MVCRNVGNELSTLAGQHPGTAKASCGMFSSKKGNSVARFKVAPYKTNIYFNVLKYGSNAVTGSRLHSSNKVWSPLTTKMTSKSFKLYRAKSIQSHKTFRLSMGIWENWWSCNPRWMGVLGNGKVHPRTGLEGWEGEYRYSSTLSLTSALDGVGGERHAPAALPPGKTR